MAIQDVVLGDPTEIVSPVTPVTTNAVSYRSRGEHETIYATPAGTIAAMTLNFPPVDGSRLGQVIRIVSHQIVTTLTVAANGNTILGSALTALAVDTPVAWLKIAASTWVRL